MRTSGPCLIGLLALAGCGQSAAGVPAETAAQPAPSAQASRSRTPLARERRDRTVHSLYDRLGAPADRAPVGQCPLELAGASVGAEQTVDGAALVFTTSQSVPELRRRVAELAKQSARTPPAARQRMDNVEHGVRLIFVPTRAADLDALREQIRQRSERMLESCPQLRIAELPGADGEGQATPAESERQPTAGRDEAKAEPAAPSILDQVSEEPEPEPEPGAGPEHDEQDGTSDGEPDHEGGAGDDGENDERPRPPLIEDGADGLGQPSSKRPLR
jgi:hypothetical protein